MSACVSYFHNHHQLISFLQMLLLREYCSTSNILKSYQSYWIRIILVVLLISLTLMASAGLKKVMPVFDLLPRGSLSLWIQIWIDLDFPISAPPFTGATGNIPQEGGRSPLHPCEVQDQTARSESLASHPLPWDVGGWGARKKQKAHDTQKNCLKDYYHIYIIYSLYTYIVTTKFNCSMGANRINNWK